MSAIQTLDARPEEASFSMRTEERETAKRMKSLFGKDFEEEEDIVASKGEEK